MAIRLACLIAFGALLGGCASRAPAGPVSATAPLPLPEPRSEDWSMFRDDVERSGFAEGSSVGGAVEVLWRIPIFNTTKYGAAKGSPSVVGDVVYCGTDTGKFVAVHAGDGAILWQAQFGKTSHGVHGSPAIVGDFVYVGAYDGTIYAFERSTGAVRWRYQLGYQVGSSPAVVPAWGMLFSSHEKSPEGGGYVVALDARTGAELWRRPTEAHPHSSVAVDVEKKLVFVGDNRGIIYQFDAMTGQEGWRHEIDRGDGKADVKTTPTVIPDKNLVVVGAWSGEVLALDESSGKLMWKNATGGRLMGSTAYLQAQDTLFVGSPAGQLFAIDARDGSTRWSFHVGAPIVSSPALSGDGRAVVFGANNGKVYALRTDTGSELWDVRLGGKVSGSPTLVGDRIYVTAAEGGLWALSTHD